MKRRILLVVLLACGVGLFYWSGLHRTLDADAVRSIVERAGWFGPALFVLLFGLQGFGFPAIVLVGAATLLWPPWIAFTTCWAGSIFGGAVGFLFARTLGREWVAERLPDRMRRYEQKIVERGLRTVILFRLLFSFANPANWVLGLSPVPFTVFLLGSAIGLVPGLAMFTLGGGAVLSWYDGREGQLVLHAAAIAVIALLGVWLWRRFQSNRVGPRAGLTAR